MWRCKCKRSWEGYWKWRGCCRSYDYYKEGSTQYQFNNLSSVNRITFKIDLNNKAYGKDEEILEEIKEVLLSAGFEDDGTSITKYESGLYQEVDVRNSSGSISLDFTFSKVD